MAQLFPNMRLSVKVALMGAGSVLITATALVILSVWQSGQYNNLAQKEVDDLIEADLNHITQSVYNLVRTEDEAVQSQIDTNLNVAKHILEDAGGASLANESITWTATNQFTKESVEVNLPKFFVGKKWLGKITDPAIETPIVDKTTHLVGETATIFQRINDQGDMLRVATTVQTTTNERAIGTYIPAVTPDGSHNAVISTILKGETYHGRAYVVNAWYITAYEPIFDQAGSLVGMLYVGVKQETVAARIRQAILQSSVGKTGYVYVVGGKGEERGRYVISYNALRDGEDVWDVRDSDGQYVTQEIVNRALDLKPGTMTTIRYRWQNLGEPAPRWKIARLAYYAPWDWVIGTSVYEDELQAYESMLRKGRIRMIRIMGLAGLVIIALIGLLGMCITWSIMRPVRQMTEVAEKIIDGDFHQVVPVTTQDEIGILAHTFNIMTDKLNHSMENLRESEEKYRGIFEYAIEGLYQSSLAGRFISANPALARILGYDSPEDLIVNITDIKHDFYVNPNDRDTLLAAISNHRQAFGFEIQCYRKDRRKIWISISARMRHDEAGNPAFIEGFITDINARKLTEEALVESKNYLDEIINSVGDPLFVKDQHHRWVLINNALCNLMGRSRNELLGKSDYDFFPKEEADIFWEKDELVLARGTESINEESFTGAHDIVYTIVTKKTLYTNKNGEKYIVGIIRDITDQRRAEAEKKRLEAQLNQSQRMEAIGTLAGGVAHDFNNILQPMLGYAELLKMHLPADNPQHRYVDRLYTAGLRAKSLVDQILTFSRLSERTIAPVQLQTVLEEVYKLCRSTIPANILIRKNIQNNCSSVLLDPSQFHQVAMNLIINAYHAIEQTGGEISICLQETVLKNDQMKDTSLPPGRYALFSVADTGCGIEPSIMDKIFDPYFTTKEQGKGTGLGLAVVYGIVKELKGDIKILSEVGKGTTINIYLPLTGASVEVSSPAAAAQTFPTGSERILLVDDEAMIIEMETLMLEELGYQVTSRLSSIEALELFKTNPQAYDLVITDLTMPQMTGDHLSKEIIAVNPAMPIIICSGYGEMIGSAQAKAIGIKMLLKKPTTIAEMSQKVRMVLDEALAATHEKRPPADDLNDE